MSSALERYTIGNRERTLLRKLEEFRQKSVPLTPREFCRLVGYSGTGSIRRFKVLKAALNDYGWKTMPGLMRGEAPSTVADFDLTPDPRVLELERETERLREESRELLELRTELATVRRDLIAARGILMAMTTHFAAADYRRAQDIEARLFKAASEHITSLRDEEDNAATADSGELDALLDDLQQDW